MPHRVRQTQNYAKNLHGVRPCFRVRVTGDLEDAVRGGILLLPVRQHGREVGRIDPDSLPHSGFRGLAAFSNAELERDLEVVLSRKTMMSAARICMMSIVRR